MKRNLQEVTWGGQSTLIALYVIENLEKVDSNKKG